MDYEFYRVDYTICGITYPGTLKILPSSGLKTEQKVIRSYLPPLHYAAYFLCRWSQGQVLTNEFAVGDKNGVLQCLSIKDEEPIVQFKTLPGKPITSVQLASANGAHGDKIFAAAGNEVKGYTRKGKVFLTVETAFSETITSMTVVGSDLILCSGRTITFYSDLQECNSYTCEDRVLDIAAFEKPNSAKFCLLVLTANKGTAIIENAQLVTSIAVPSGPSCLAVIPSNPTTEVFSYYGATDGSIGMITYNQKILSFKCLVEGQTLGSVVCLGWYFSGGNNHLAVGRHDGSVQLYLIDNDNLSSKPRLKFTYFCGEPVTSINGGYIGTEEQELLVASFSGRIFSLRSGRLSSAAAFSKLPQDALTARRAKLEAEIARLEKQTANERNKYQRSTRSINSTLSTPPLLDVQYEVLGATKDGWLETRLISAVPLDMLFIYCNTKLIMQTDNAAVLSVCPSQEISTDFLATIRCQAGTRRLWVQMRRGLKLKSTEEADSVLVYIYALPAGAPRVARLISVRLPALAYYSQPEDLSCEKQSRYWCELRVSGSFSVAEITSWLTEALPGDLPRPATSINIARSHALIGTLLICKYQRGLAVFKSDNVSTIATMRSVVSNCSVRKGIKAELSYDIPQSCLIHSFKRLEYQFKMEYQKKRDIDLRKAINNLDLDMSTVNNNEQILCNEYMLILNSSGEKHEVTFFEELMDIVIQWNADWHMLSLNGDNSNNKSEQLKTALQECNISEISNIISNNLIILPEEQL